MRISDWSSDVCSSDLVFPAREFKHRDVSRASRGPAGEARGAACLSNPGATGAAPAEELDQADFSVPLGSTLRSDARRVGKEGVRTWQLRWSPYHYKKPEMRRSLSSGK